MADSVRIPPADIYPSPPSTPTDQRPVGGRKPKGDEGNGLVPKSGDLTKGALPNSGMEAPGASLPEDEKSSLKIKIHLNLHAKVRLDLDAQIYGDVVIGLL
ncbi:hypothetical protein N7468_010026 [Penicillium chermesinum]|uniref:Uncharacterized protein n=1 Tax=Penicillium chermesinum TaxID=63820 RepID=A0A9W9NBY5_9EURO|nr:uncharacterized protein N7468_010026 [Penicillium chermesinum]KAJ5217018.1 hypothetical protein N7468_010026 [Penicillium chermesinum]